VYYQPTQRLSPSWKMQWLGKMIANHFWRKLNTYISGFRQLGFFFFLFIKCSFASHHGAFSMTLIVFRCWICCCYLPNRSVTHGRVFQRLVTSSSLIGDILLSYWWQDWFRVLLPDPFIHGYVIKNNLKLSTSQHNKKQINSSQIHTLSSFCPTLVLVIFPPRPLLLQTAK